MIAACLSVNDGKSQRRAAEEHSVPLSTLNRKIQQCRTNPDVIQSVCKKSR